MIATLYKGKTCKHWAQELGVHVETIRTHLKKHGHLDKIDLDTKKNPSPKYKGKTYRQWAELYGIHWNTIDYHIRKHGHLNKVKPKTAKEIEKNNKHHRPEKEIYKNFYKGKPLRQWARDLGVSYDKVNGHIKKYGNLDKIHLSTQDLKKIAMQKEMQKRKLTKLQKELQQHEESVEYMN